MIFEQFETMLWKELMQRSDRIYPSFLRAENKGSEAELWNPEVIYRAFSQKYISL